MCGEKCCFLPLHPDLAHYWTAWEQPRRRRAVTPEKDTMSPTRRLITFAAWPVLFAPAALAARPQTTSLLSLEEGGGTLSVPVRIILLLSLLTLLPAVIASVTPFLRITIVLHFLRQALGTQTVPSNQVLMGLALFLTILVM